MTEQLDFHEIRYASFCEMSSTRQRRENFVSDSYTLLKDVNGFVPLFSVSLHRCEINLTSKISLVAPSVCEIGDNFCTAGCIS